MAFGNVLTGEIEMCQQITQQTGVIVDPIYTLLRKNVNSCISSNYFMLRAAIDHIINSAAKSNYMSTGQINVPIVFRGPNGAVAGVGAQHSQCFAAWYDACAGLKVLAPYSSEDALELLKATIRDPDPIVFLENELFFCLPIRKAKVERKGKDVTIITFSRMVGYAIKVSNNEEGVASEIFTRSLMSNEMEISNACGNGDQDSLLGEQQ
ncbi:pyruvate dehydrogenase E1 component subunit beta-1, mitochondrial-like [Camellia sinensis]|uniref:pyruvate dehydrogenase E1 component subunit beta-1, mitochondrial-like n=1 Tax=Camellia sinensis TaxID=4442 RepID=UPI001035BE1E|nr:pyruvate dehydrogenase E1 component subunit beta-1, mitochondrial-like [Camellia sinensis]